MTAQTAPTEQELRDELALPLLGERKIDILHDVVRMLFVTHRRDGLADVTEDDRHLQVLETVSRR